MWGQPTIPIDWSRVRGNAARNLLTRDAARAADLLTNLRADAGAAPQTKAA